MEKLFLVTGANSGLGKVSILLLARILLACELAKKLDKLKVNVKTLCPGFTFDNLF